MHLLAIVHAHGVCALAPGKHCSTSWYEVSYSQKFTLNKNFAQPTYQLLNKLFFWNKFRPCDKNRHGVYVSLTQDKNSQDKNSSMRVVTK